jgi:hypothetical protein
MNIQVKSHERKKPSKPPEYISKHEQLRAEVAAMGQVNEFRDVISYQPGTNALLLIAGRLKLLALRAKELVN